ncbi:hypothetical protein [Paenibacillus sacheonensis]|uniref:Uncharacterized protein n=1 Tax=Paenibacillus sacheonensis TaxID=742054 RepID=A0A7X5C138_9BACL|nr:hypothetical protein [Paenibacillus sacheonensis]MBM7565686.1 hypothetical protein [Paenibacillus sacheonensis]NBC72256.1 hypothetical protein [Paenibacillus sacheonensis]
MKIVCSLELHLPEDKLPGYYAQIIKGIADIVTLLDRHKTLLFVNTPEECEAIIRFVAKYKVDCERGTWLQLEEAWEPNDRMFADYGLQTREGNTFVDLGLAAVVALSAGEDPSSEYVQALEQAEEHAIASLTQEDGRRLLAVDRHQAELIAGIARAYRCAYELIQPAAAPFAL